MWKKFLSLFKIEKYEALGSHQYWYVNADNVKVFTVSVTFYMTASGKRKITMEYDKNYTLLYSPQNHQFYHNICVTFLNKTFPFNLSDEDTKIAVKEMCKLNYEKTAAVNWKSIKKEKKSIPKEKSDSNVINLSDFSKDK